MASIPTIPNPDLYEPFRDRNFLVLPICAVGGQTSPDAWAAALGGKGFVPPQQQWNTAQRAIVMALVITKLHYFAGFLSLKDHFWIATLKSPFCSQ